MDWFDWMLCAGSVLAAAVVGWLIQTPRDLPGPVTGLMVGACAAVVGLSWVAVASHTLDVLAR